eukprot:TRINITY_DN97383_c0_g1_i1.p1 TRINITY_DN97383_c0_g1~~TRINITY_DN97383_c0_g1_i1.p1  ORF type:complete len:220 (-),score=41.12 TRINITY_DN97383_c0_g1_i1:22-681(-)
MARYGILLACCMHMARAASTGFLAPTTEPGTAEKYAATTVQGFPLPAYLELLTPSDPEYAALNQSAFQYAVKKPGMGGLLDFVVVRLKEDVPMRRIYGGSAVKNGYWWTLANASGMFWASGVDRISMCDMMTASGVCPEWNGATSLITCMVRKGWTFVVGQGQSARCRLGAEVCDIKNGSVIFPPAALLQVNGDVFSNSLRCQECELDRRDTIDSSCYV